MNSVPTTDDAPGAALTAAGWTPARIRALGPVTDVPTAAAIFGIGRSAAYELVQRGAFPVPVLRIGARYRVPVAAILTALHLPVETVDEQRRPTT
ncbi:helix-turn-helix transcriptional regulator [Actinoplanes aureus]|uniref:Helix-turn-helix domain-containing protein n=1 Tax=Actinoplanes aureus TaxID=2792083 RepID=A0A931G7F8_9ACTN|nr:helix-turn-helix domain-containing protein [Actinoplanes aureus]MBG0568199.1 helix-turn-helix domain-containing protein [Actinoplanes aureus]